MADSSKNVLDPDSVVSLMIRSLPSRPTRELVPLVKDAYSAVALLAHSCMLAVGFRLTGLGEDHRIAASSDGGDVNELPTEWDASSSTYAFRYAHSQSSMEFLMKVTRLGSKALIYGVGIPDDKTASLEMKIQDYVSEGSIKESSTHAEPATAFMNIFISKGRMVDLTQLFKVSIIQKLVPGLHKEGYEESRADTGRQEPAQAEDRQRLQRDPVRDDRSEPARRMPLPDLPLAAPRRPQPTGDFLPPGFEDEYDMYRPPRRYPGVEGERPWNIGERDLYPPGLGPHDPLRIGPGGGGFRPGGGMHPTFDDPLFGGRAEPGAPDLRAPPGARYDPTGPFDQPPSGRGGPGFPGGRGGSGGNPFGGFGSGDFI